MEISVPEKNELDLALDQEETALQESFAEAFALARRSPTRANTGAYERAKSTLEEFRRARAEILVEDRVFSTVLAVVDYLVKEGGFRVSKTKVYDDNNADLIKKQADGTFRLQDVDDYARDFLKPPDGSRSGARGTLQEEKLRGEIERVQTDVETKKLKLQTSRGEVIPRDQVEIELGSRATFLRSDLKNVGRAGVMEIIKKVKGDPQKAAAFVSWWIVVVDEIMDRYARPINGADDGK